jgi:hypothetical protein
MIRSFRLFVRFVIALSVFPESLGQFRGLRRASSCLRVQRFARVMTEDATGRSPAPQAYREAVTM